MSRKTNIGHESTRTNPQVSENCRNFQKESTDQDLGKEEEEERRIYGFFTLGADHIPSF